MANALFLFVECALISIMYRKDKKDEFYTRKSREEGYPARSVYKLKEIDEKYGIFKKGDKVLDLGCAPGSWMKYISEKISDNGKVVGVDLAELNIPLAKNMVFIQKSIFDLTPDELGNKKFQAVISDMAPKTSGIKLADEALSFELAENAWEAAKKFLAPNGIFLCKIFESEIIRDFFREIEKNFEFAKRFRPQAVIKGSSEIYLVARGYRVNN